MFTHTPVLLKETIDSLNIKSDGIYLDLTLGRGGHSKEILKKLKTGRLIAIDQDEEAIKESEKILNKISPNYLLIHDNFVNLENILKKLNIDKVDGILMDLGVSSPQFDDPSRGFSYKENAPLDMRMDLNTKLNAKTIVNTYSFDELFKIFKEYGEDKYAYSVAKNIVKEREKKEINTTYELVDIIKKSKPMKELKKAGHPAKQIFQALRIATNDELEVLKKTIKVAAHHLKRNGRFGVISFHSLEDRIIKNYFRSLSIQEGNRLDIPDIIEKDFNLVTTHPIKASQEEVNNNHRAKSATLRVIERK